MARGRVLVAGAGGFLGAAIAEAFRDAGWSARGLVRRPVPAHRLERIGVPTEVVDIRDPIAVESHCREADVVVHVAAAAGSDDPSENDQVRVRGGRNIVLAARRNGVRRVVLGSGYWVYADHAGLIDESSALDPRGESRVNRAAEVAALEGGGPEGPEVTVVRPGMVYGDGSWFRSVALASRARGYRVIEGGANPWSFVSLRDAARGFVAVAERGRAGEVYNLVDGRPVAWRAFAEGVAEGLGVPPPGNLTRAEAEEEFGPDVAYHFAARRACTSAKITGLGWTPDHPDVLRGIETTLDAIRRAP